MCSKEENEILFFVQTTEKQATRSYTKRDHNLHTIPKRPWTRLQNPKS